MFENFTFSVNQVSRYHQSAIKDLNIARKSNIPEVVFKFSYDALLKLAIAVCAKNSLRIKSKQGHHVELINRLADILKNQDIRAIGNDMRAKRNFDLYGGGTLISKKQTEEYLRWIAEIFIIADKYINRNKKLL